MKHKRNSPWVWIPSLFATEAIVSATLTYVALLMFIQLGASYFKATLLSALLLLPSVCKLLIRWNHRWNLLLRLFIIVTNCLIFASFVLTALIVNATNADLFKVFASLFLVSVLNALNERLIAIYYHNVLNRGMQRILGNYKFVASQFAFILTYGILIIFVGFHEIFFRNIHLAWSMQYYMVAGVLLILVIINSFLLVKPRINAATSYNHQFKWMNSPKIRMRNLRFFLIMALLLLPQSLLFCTRVFFLMAPQSRGGLDCTLQDVGFAQGTIGVMAFMAGTFIGQHLIRRFGNKNMFWVMVPPLLMSPVLYLLMVCFMMPAQLPVICLISFGAQLCFGFGLNICVFLIKRTTDVFDENILSLVHVPLVTVSMFIPIALSGLLVQFLSFKNFFIIDASLSAVALVVLLANRNFVNRHIIHYHHIK